MRIAKEEQRFYNKEFLRGSIESLEILCERLDMCQELGVKPNPNTIKRDIQNITNFLKQIEL